MGKDRRTHNKALLAGLFCAAVLCLTACKSMPVTQPTSVTLPEATVAFIAPIGDSALEYTANVTLYLPRHDGSRLISLTSAVAFSAARLDAESVVRALLLYPGDSMASAMGGEVKLALYGANPVEVSGDVATVNLAASALQLDQKTLYLCSQAITNTLTELGNIHYVNILIMDKQIGLDLGSTLPTGAFTRSMAGDVGAVYEQVLSQRVQANENPADKRLNATATLYFPLSAVNGVISEARNISFTSQAQESMAVRLIQELAEGPGMVQGSPTLPLLADMLTETPTVTDDTGGGGKRITLRFDATLYDMLTTMGVSRVNCFGALCYTLSTFMPNVTGIEIYVGDEHIEHVMIGATEGLLFDNGILRRSNFSQFLMDTCTLYFADAQDNRLVAVRRPISFYMRTNPRALLLALFGGPTIADDVQGLKPVVPYGLFSDADILGLSLTDRTLLVNLSIQFSQAGKGITAQQERLMAYAMVNTLLENSRANRLCFFMGGQAPTGFTGEIYWPGMFYINLGLVQNDS